MALRGFGGFFEVHITVDERSDDGAFYKLWAYAQTRDMKVVMAVSNHGLRKTQLMLTKNLSGYTYAKVMKYTDRVYNELCQTMKVLRVKIECGATHDCVPQSEADLKEYMEINQKELMGTPYFEFHAKVRLNSLSQEAFENWLKYIVTIVHPEVYIGSSVNICGSKTNILTIRVMERGRHIAFTEKERILKKVQEAGFSIESHQREFCIYDDNIDIDLEWLIPGQKQHRTKR